MSASSSSGSGMDSGAECEGSGGVGPVGLSRQSTICTISSIDEGQWGKTEHGAPALSVLLSNTFFLDTHTFILQISNALFY